MTSELSVTWSEYQQYIKNSQNYWNSLKEWCGQMGIFGEVFLREFALCECSFEISAADMIDPAQQLFGGYYSSYDRGIFQKQIFFTRNVLQDSLNFFSSCVHESIHAIQYNTSAALHARADNQFTSVIICPRDRILLTELIERDAYSKEQFFLYLYHALQSGKTDEVEKDLHDNAHVQHSLQYYSKRALRERMDNGVSYRHHYVDAALNAYEGTMLSWCQWREQSGYDIDYVRLEEEDLWSLGNSLGLNSLYETPQQIRQEPFILKDEQRQRLLLLNEKLGIQDDQAIPTFGEALKKFGVTRSDFLASAVRNWPV